MLTATADVSNDKLTIVWDRQRGISLTARIAPDGSISGQQSVGRNGVLEIKGKVKDASTLDYDFVSARCARHFVVKKG